MLTSVSRMTLLSAGFVVAFIPATFALEADVFGEKFKETFSATGFSFDYAQARVEGDSVILSDFTVFMPDEEQPIELTGDITFEGVVETGDGGYTAERATVADFEHEDEDEELTVTVQNVVVEGLVLPGDPDADPLSSVLLYERISVGPIRVAEAGNEVMAIDAIEVYVDSDDARTEITSGYSVSGIAVDLSAVDDEEGQAIIDAFGTERIEASLTGTGIWYPQTGDIELTEMAFDIDQLARLNVTASLSGYTMDVYSNVIKLQQKMAEVGPDITEEEMAEFERAVWDEFSALQINGLSVRYDDSSLLYKVLDFVAAEQGVDGATLANGLKFMVPMALAEVDNAAFTSQVTEAVNAFLDDPQNLEIAAEPAQPVGIGNFEGIEDDPFALIDELGLTVRANQ